jgi:hypothetical protein
MVEGARTPEELELLLEDAIVVQDRGMLRGLFEDGAALVLARGRPVVSGPPRIAELLVRLGSEGGGFVAEVGQVVRSRNLALVVSADAVSVVRRDERGVWRYIILCLTRDRRIGSRSSAGF